MPKEEKKKRITPVTVEIVPSEESHEAPIEMEQKEDPPTHEVHEVPEPTPEVKPHKEKAGFSFGFFVIVMIVALFVALFAGALYVYFTGISDIVHPSPTPMVSPTPLPAESAAPSGTPSASAKPTATPKVADLKVSVLNGSGKIGEANKVKNMIEKAGFKVTQTGNANSFDFTDTVIQTKTTVSSEVRQLLKDALKGYTLKDGDTLDTKNIYDIIVTIGAK